jgi:predicted ATPase
MAKSTPQLTRITHLSLENWRNFTRVDTPLQRRVFVYGPNASGKSNLLDALRFLRDIVLVGGGFQEAVRRRGGVSKLRSLAARRYPDVALKVSIGGETQDSWEYEIRFNQDNRQRPVLSREQVLRNGELIVQRPNAEDEQDRERLSQTFLEQVNANRSFRDIAGFFASIQYLHLVPQLIREPDRSVGITNDPYGGDFLERIARTSPRTRAARLRRIQDALRIAVPQLNALELWRDPASGTPHLRGKYEHWRSQGAWQTEEQFSDGTLRLIGLLWVVLDGGGPLLLEEPELSLHADVIRFIPQMLARVQRKSQRQVFVSSHSAEILRDTGIGVDEVLVLQPGSEGTTVRTLQDNPAVAALLDHGDMLAEIVSAKTSPANVEQLALFEP